MSDRTVGDPDYRDWRADPLVVSETNLVASSILRPTSFPPSTDSVNYWDSGFINGQHPDMENDDIGPVAVVLGAAVVTLGAMTVVASIVALLVAAIRKIFGR
jgi:hypothetical protein